MKDRLKEKTAKYIIMLSLICTVFTGCSQEAEKNNYKNTDFAMGTVIVQNIYGSNGQLVSEKVLDVITSLENMISWRIDGTIVNQLNLIAGQGSGVTPGKDDFIDWMEQCIEVYEKSNGLLDITVGPAARLWDIGGENPRIPEESELNEALKLIDGSKLRVVEDTVYFDTKGGQLDLGAVGKGIACDEIFAYLSGHEVKVNGTFSVGGSILVYGKKHDGEPWNIGIQDPREETGNYMASLQIFQKEGDAVFISTSGDYEKYFEKDGVRYHHILDPRTGAPAESDLMSVTIISDSGFLSDALSTACFVAGSENGLALAKTYGAEIIMVDKEKRVYASEGAKKMCTLLGKEYSYEEK